MNYDALDALVRAGSGGPPTASFPTIGTTWKGTVLDVDHIEQTDPDGNVKKWDDGKPRMQFVFTIQSDVRDATIDDDDGRRRIFAKGQMQKAVLEAIKATGATKEQIVGGTLAVQYTGDGTPSKPAYNPPKQYVAQFAPAAPAAVNNLLGDATPAPAAPPASSLI